jgi:hypothetical protein
MQASNFKPGNGSSDETDIAVGQRIFSTDKQGPMHTDISSIHSSKNLTIAQLVTSSQNTFAYVSCEKAFSSGLIEVREINDAGSVNTIFVLNKSDQFIFLMDGDILAGAKQNRVVNAPIMLAPQSKTHIPASCVARGRWSPSGGEFRVAEYTAPAILRAEKAAQVMMSLGRNKGFASNQGQIWDRVDSLQSHLRVNSPTSNISDIYEKKETDFGEFIAGFPHDPLANGIAVFVGENLTHIDIFNRTDVYLDYFPKMLRGAALDAEATVKKGRNPASAEARFRILDLLDDFEQQEFDERPGVGVGKDRRFHAPGLTGFELVFGDHLIHRAAFRRDVPEKEVRYSCNAG